MLKLIDRLIPRYAHKYLIVCALTQFLAYFCTKLVHLRGYVDISLSVDHMIPVRSGWVTVYVLSYIFWALGYIAVSRISRERFMRLFRADLMAKVVCAVLFVLMPTTISRPEFTSDNVFSWALNVIYALDTPVNLFPSMHCLLSWLLARELMDIKQLRPAVRWGAAVFAVLVFVSTLFTRQHFILDIPAGVLTAEAARFASRLYERRRKTPEEVK